jgi:ABC-type transporter Mla subunit MlaD
MLSERPRNLIVGLTMIVALGVLIYGSFLLGKLPKFGAGRPYDVTLLADDANGVTAGTAVSFKGVHAGQVKSVGLYTDAAGKLGAKVVLEIGSTFEIPADAVATLTQPAAGVGSPKVTIDATNMNGPKLPHDGTAVLAAKAGDNGLIPKDVFADLKTAFTDVHDLKQDLSRLAGELNQVARDLHTLLAYAPPEAIDAANPADPNRARENVSTVVVRLNRMAKSLQDLLADPALQGQVRLAVQNIADASGQLKQTLQSIQSVAGNANTGIAAFNGAATQAAETMQVTQREISRVSQGLVEMLAQVQKATQQLAEGNGTTGKLINDPRLYDGLLDLSKSLKITVDDLDFLLKKWKDEGVNLKL